MQRAAASSVYSMAYGESRPGGILGEAYHEIEYIEMNHMPSYVAMSMILRP